MIKLKKTKREFEILLAEEGCTQRALANVLKVSPVQITNLKNNKHRGLGEIKVRKLCRIFNIEFDEWFEKVKTSKISLD